MVEKYEYIGADGAYVNRAIKNDRGAGINIPPDDELEKRAQSKVIIGNGGTVGEFSAREVVRAQGILAARKER